MDRLDTLMILACSIVWLIVPIIFRIFTPLTLRGELLTLWVLIFACYLFIILYNPSKKKMDTDILNAKQDYFDNKDKLNQIYADQLKDKWSNDMVIRNRYYITMFIIWCYIPIPFYMIYLLYPTKNQFTLDNSVSTAFASLVLTSMIAIFLWSGYTIGFLHMGYVIATFLFTVILLFILYKRFDVSAYLLFFALAGMIALITWGIIAVGIIPLLYVFISLAVIGAMAYSIIL